MSSLEIRRADRFTQLTVVAVEEAVQQAGWPDAPPAPAERLGCVVATSLGGMHTIEEAQRTLAARGPSRLSPLDTPRLMPNAAAAAVAIRYGLEGESYGLAAACASGAQAIGAGARMLAAGEADAMIVGGADARLTEMMLASLGVMRATSKTGISRPFDRRRDGFIPSEGAAMLVLEREEVARSRGAVILGELLGYGASSDAHSLVAPRPDGRGPVRAMRLAIERAGIGAQDVDYVNAHGTSTRINDQIEVDAIKEVLGARAWEIPVSSTKSAIGHLAGAAGSVEAVMTLLTLRRGLAPPTVGLEQPDDGLGLDFVPDEPRPLSRAAAGTRLIGLTNSFGLGGHNATVALASEPTLS